MSFTTRHIDAPQELHIPNVNFIKTGSRKDADSGVEDNSESNHSNSHQQTLGEDGETSAKKILAVSSFQDMIGVLKQVNFLAFHASSIFTSLGKRLGETGDKLGKISSRIVKLENNILNLEEEKRHNNRINLNNSTNNPNTYMESNKSSKLRDENQSFQNFFTSLTN